MCPRFKKKYYTAGSPKPQCMPKDDYWQTLELTSAILVNAKYFCSILSVLVLLEIDILWGCFYFLRPSRLPDCHKSTYIGIALCDLN